ncbi:uncharacterized protein [Onthophagus taurus]|uniref:uncharacterized protein n=1 Tax=Onthophagus taurus TaxID=166361 RepID=UPI0039BE8C2D
MYLIISVRSIKAMFPLKLNLLILFITFTFLNGDINLMSLSDEKNFSVFRKLKLSFIDYYGIDVVMPREMISSEMIDYILSGNFIRSPVKITSYDEKRVYYKSHIFFANDLSDIIDFSNYLRKSYNTIGKIYYILCEPIENDSQEMWKPIFEKLWKYKLLHYLILNTKGVTPAMSYNPFEGNIMEIKKFRRSFYTNDNLLKDVKGYRIKLTSIEKYFEFNHVDYYPTDQALVRTFIKFINASIEHISFEHIIHSGFRIKTDFGLAPGLVSSLLLNMSYLYPYSRDDFEVVVPHRGQLLSKHLASRIFDNYVWCALIVAMFIALLTLLIIKLILKESFENIKLIFHFMGVMFQVPTPHLNVNVKAWPVKFIWISWLFICLILHTAFSSILISALVKPPAEDEINTIEELLESDLNITLVTRFASIFHQSNNPTSKAIADRLILGTRNDIINKLMSGDTSSAYSLRRSDLRSLKLPTINGKKVYHIMNQYLIPCLSTVGFGLGNVFDKRMQLVVSRLFEGGILNRKKRQKVIVEQVEYQIEFNHWYWILFLYFMGCVLAVITFFLELLWCKLAKIKFKGIYNIQYMMQ